MDDFSEKTHKTECDFYGMFNDVNDGFAPRVYYTELATKSKPGFIVMDDLSARCVTSGMFRSCTTQQIWNVAKKAAHFQAVAACNNKDFSRFKDDFHAKNFHTDVFNPTIGLLVE